VAAFITLCGCSGRDPFWVVNGDISCDFSFAPRELPGRTLAHLVLVPNPEHHPGGDFVLRDGRIAGADTAESARLTFAGISILTPALFRTPPGRDAFRWRLCCVPLPDTDR
jgi:MurNAc alpha-1-phosphate uridylyltransferase